VINYDLVPENIGFLVRDYFDQLARARRGAGGGERKGLTEEVLIRGEIWKRQCAEGRRAVEALREMLGRFIIGQDPVVDVFDLRRRFADGHCWIEGLGPAGEDLCIRRGRVFVDFYASIHAGPDAAGHHGPDPTTAVVLPSRSVFNGVPAALA